MVIGATIITTYNNKTFRIDDIDENSDPTSEYYESIDGNKKSFMQYYKEVCSLLYKKYFID